MKQPFQHYPVLSTETRKPYGFKPELIEEPPEFMSFVQAEAILGVAGSNGNLYYEDLVGCNPYPQQWDDLMPENFKNGHEYNHAQARRGFGNFMRVLSDEFTKKVGLSPIPEGYDLSGFGNMDGLTDIAYEAGCRREGRPQIKLIPQAHYQTPRQRAKDDDEDPPKSTFLHFGLYDDSPIKLSPQFDGEVRLYMNPTVENTPEVAARLCRGFIINHGYMPTGKFREDVTSKYIEERNDRLLFWLKSPEELTTLVRLTHDLQQSDPQLFNKGKSIVLGDAVSVNGKQLDTVRIAQEPHQAEEGKTSFSNYCRIPLQKAIREVFQQSVPDVRTPASINSFIMALRQHSQTFHRNPSSFSFNQNQDMRIIESAIKAAEKPKKYSF